MEITAETINMTSLSLNMENYPKTTEKALEADAKLSKKLGRNIKDMQWNLELLLKHGKVEVGYRCSCGTTDPTMYMWREWVKIVAWAKKEGAAITEEPIKHSNSWATKKGGFWNSTIFHLVGPKVVKE